MKRGMLLFVFCLAFPTMGQVTIQPGCGKEEIAIVAKPGKRTKVKKILEKAFLWVRFRGGNLILDVERDSMGTMIRRVQQVLDDKGQKPRIASCAPIPTTYSEVTSEYKALP